MEFYIKLYFKQKPVDKKYNFVLFFSIRESNQIKNLNISTDLAGRSFFDLISECKDFSYLFLKHLFITFLPKTLSTSNKNQQKEEETFYNI
jgi:hypothetical protein